MDNQVKTREWVKTAAIIFLAVLLVLTFFSNTILNASLKPVMGQTVQGGTIKARITGQGTIKADETYDITINQTRKIGSVKAKVGKAVEVGDVLFVLEAQDSEELKTAQNDLAALQLAYDKALVEAGNATLKEDHDVQNAKAKYEEAVERYKSFADFDPELLAVEKEAAAKDKAYYDRLKAECDSEKAKAESERSRLSTEYTTLSQTVEAAKKAQTTARAALVEKGVDFPKESAESIRTGITNAQNAIVDTKTKMPIEVGKFDIGCRFLAKLTNYNVTLMNTYITEQKAVLIEALSAGTEEAMAVQKAATQQRYENAVYYVTDGYNTLKDYCVSICNLEVYTVQLPYQEATEIVNGNERNIEQLKSLVDLYADRVAGLERDSADAASWSAQAQAQIDKLTQAETAATEAKTAKQALEDLIFTKSLGKSSGLDLEDSKKKIEKKQAEVDELLANADEVEIKSTVAGVIAAVNVTAGKTAGKGDVLATVNLVDKGYTIKIPVTAEQARRVTVGDTAETNSWSNSITATLESIAPNPESKDGGKLLVFRLTGEVTPDQTLTVSIGQKSQNYDIVIPKAAYRSDTNGNFVYVLTVKKTPLNNRYVAQRVDVTVLAEDDNNYAVSGLNYGDFIIVNVNGQITDGEEVRLAENAG